MTASFHVPPPPSREPLRWRRAWRALRALLADPDDTEKAVELSYAIGRDDFERSFQRLLGSPFGARLLASRPSLADALSDRTALEGLPAESLGRAYLEYLDDNGFAATGLLAVEQRVRERWQREGEVPPLDPLRGWYRDRMILSHDLFHVLTGYGTDDVGEATLLAFSLAQLGGRANALLTAGAAFEVWRTRGLGWLRYAFRAWRRGSSAVPLAALPWEELLPLRLETVRDLAAVRASDVAHPGGIWSGRARAQAGA